MCDTSMSSRTPVIELGGTPQMLTGAQAVLACLLEEGVEYLYGYPGGQAIELYDALYDEPRIKHILVRHEQGATHAADGYARATGKPGVCMVTSGPGATNTVSGIMTAYMDSIPLIVITGQVATRLIGTDAFQESDITGITLPIVKHSYLIKDPCDIARTFKEAFHLARTGRPGPVVIDIPSDVQKARFEFSYPAEVDMPSYKPTIKGHVRQIKQAARALMSAERPVMLIGGGVRVAQAGAEVTQLAELLQIPVCNTLMAKGEMDDDHPLSLNMVGMHGTRAAAYAVQNCDLLMCVGARFDDRVTMNLNGFAPRAKIMHIDIDPAEISKNIDPNIPIVGDAQHVLRAIIEELQRGGITPHERAEEWVDQLRQLREHRPLCYDDSTPTSIPPQKIMERLHDLARERACDLAVTTEVGQHQMWAAQFIRAHRPRRFITSGGAGTMGYGFPASIGVAHALPEALVVCVAGDGSFQMNIQELATVVAHQIPVKILLINNAALGMVCQWQEILYQGRISHTSFDTYAPNFVEIARAYGLAARRLDDPSRIDELLTWLIETPGPVLLDCVTAERELVLPMCVPGSTLSEELDMQPRKAHVSGWTSHTQSGTDCPQEKEV